MTLSSLAMPLAVAAFCVCGIAGGRNIFEDFLDGAREGFFTLWRIAPATFALCMALAVFRSSGALDLLCTALAPAMQLLGIPAEAAALVLMRPVSGAGANTLFQSILAAVGPDSYAGRVASVMMGSSDTTVYTLALYFSQTAARRQRGALPAALAGDLAAFAASAAAVRLLL
ncbi:MAG: spore maturation protein [Oscillospiraceae bacterium]|nr:spore maturation protein [Oscillospiraceae bacterium]